MYRGHNSAAGEIGFLLVESSTFGKRFEDAGDLETRLGAVTITRLAGEEGISHSGSIGAMELIALARSGGLDRRSDLVSPALRSRLEGRIQRVPVIRTASLAADAVLLGAAEMAVRAAGRYAYLA